MSQSKDSAVEVDKTVYHTKKGPSGTILDINDFSLWYGPKQALFNNTMSVEKGLVTALIGPSGCGKSTLGRVILRLQPATSGDVFFRGENVHALPSNKLLDLRSKMQIIFQDPYSSLNPRMKVGQIIGEALSVHHKLTRIEEKNRIIELLESVGLSPDHLSRYPHEFSGGQKQRIAIARALVSNPKMIIADEPVAALDVSIRSGIINLMKNLQREMNLTYLFISHDLSVVKHISKKIAVMYLGKIFELANSKQLFSNPSHPYTEALISSIPVPDPTYDGKRIILSGDVPSPVNPPSGCRFHTRCHSSTSKCSKDEPDLLEIEKDHFVACHLIE